jgi:hypothetical protein
VRIAGRSAAWLARLPWEQEVGRSNRLAPTIFVSKISIIREYDIVADRLRESRRDDAMTDKS